MFENVDGLTDNGRTDGHGSDWYTISSPMSLGSDELIIRGMQILRDPDFKYE